MKTKNYYEPLEIRLYAVRVEVLCQSSSIQNLVEEDPGLIWE